MAAGSGFGLAFRSPEQLAISMQIMSIAYLALKIPSGSILAELCRNAALKHATVMPIAYLILKLRSGSTLTELCRNAQI